MSVTTEMERALEWAAGDDTGVSSKALMTVMIGKKPRSSFCYPHDGGDFGRCYRLLKLIPEWRARIGEMGMVGAEWKALADHWAELETLFESGDQTALYMRMKDILRPAEEANTKTIRFGSGAVLHFGR